MDFLAALIPLFPVTAAVLLALGQFSGILTDGRTEAVTARLACWSIYLSTLCAAALCWSGLNGDLQGRYMAGTWLASGDFMVPFNFHSVGPGVVLSTLFSLLFVVIFRFSRNYLHNEKGFHRFFMLLSLFAGAMYMLLLSANAIGTFLGWELAGLCSFLLIAFAYHRHNASRNACLVFVTNRVGDAGFILGALSGYFWVGTLDWQEIIRAADTLSPLKINLMALFFVLAAMVKSGQYPFTWWLNRSMEGPTTSSAAFYGAVMVHSGVFLLILIGPLLERATGVSIFLVFIGLLTTVYSTLSARTQVDIKSSLGYATSAQLGLMFIECGLGLWTLAFFHLCTHAIVRCYLFLTSPSILHNVHGNPVLPVTLEHPFMKWLSLASLHNFWLEDSIRHYVTRPCGHLARDLSNMDDAFIDPLIGLPTSAVRSGAGLAFREEQKIGANLDAQEDSFSTGSGLAGKLTAWIATMTGWFEQRFVLHGMEKDLPEAGRKLGHLANHMEQVLLRPRYLFMFIIISLLFTL